jgi:hypothetical protein
MGACGRAAGGGAAASLTQHAAIVPADPPLPAWTGPDTIAPPPPPAGYRADAALVTRSLAQLSLRWEGGRWGAEAGAALGFGSVLADRRWASAGVSYRLLSPIEAYVHAGPHLARLLDGGPTAEKSVSVGLRIVPPWTPEPNLAELRPGDLAAFRLRRVGFNLYALSVVAVAAGSVDVIGDMTEWRPVALARTGGGRWTGEFALEPGIH